MAIVTLPSYGADPVTVNASNLNGKVDPLATDYNGNIQNVNIASDAAIVDTKFATISTAGKVSGTAITSGDIAIVNTSTTTIPLSITASSLTTGTLAHLYSNSTSNGLRTLLNIHNDNTSAVQTRCLNVQQDAAYYAAVINQSADYGAGLLLQGLSSFATGNVLQISGDTITTGGLCYLYSNSADTSARTLAKIHNDNASADAAIGLTITQDADAEALYIDYNATASDTLTGLRIDGCTSTGAVTCTLGTNAPAGVGTTTPTAWFHINVGGTMHYFPLWT